MDKKNTDNAKKLSKEEVKALREQVLRTRVKGGPAQLSSQLEGGTDDPSQSETW